VESETAEKRRPYTELGILLDRDPEAAAKKIKALLASTKGNASKAAREEGIAYATLGRLAPDRGNAVLVTHGNTSGPQMIDPGGSTGEGRCARAGEFYCWSSALLRDVSCRRRAANELCALPGGRDDRRVAVAMAAGPGRGGKLFL
jgi:hypothetical protein